uniref:Uncharacterized protein n=1 Tax=Escherichia coli TaxID=562 RepID=A0A899NCC8_ECOLX|nr:hypothetical protein LDMDHDEC_00138 [Escherichia coli]
MQAVRFHFDRRKHVVSGQHGRCHGNAKGRGGVDQAHVEELAQRLDAGPQRAGGLAQVHLVQVGQAGISRDQRNAVIFPVSEPAPQLVGAGGEHATGRVARIVAVQRPARIALGVQVDHGHAQAALLKVERKVTRCERLALTALLNCRDQCFHAFGSCFFLASSAHFFTMNA